MDIKISQKDEATVVFLTGRIDVPGSEMLRKSLFQICETDIKQVVLDFKEVHSICSSGIGALILFHEKFTSLKGDIKIVNLNEEINSLFHIIKLDTIFSL